MIRFLIGFCLLAGLVSCRRGTHQQVQLKNASSETIYFVISSDSILSNPNDIWSIRPITAESDLSKISDMTFREDQDSIRSKHNLYRYRIEDGGSAIMLSSESAEIFVDAVSIQSIINHRYNGKVNVFVVKESDLSQYSDEAIIEKKLYKYVTTLTEKSITEDTLTVQYF
jgi:hypothetical protein